MDHETEFVKSFITSEKRARWGQFLSDPTRRRDILARLNHHLPFRSELGTAVPGTQDFPSELERLLRSKGAGLTCHVMVDGSRLDGRDLPLAEALHAICMHGAGAVVSCIPGRLAYYRPASPGAGVILEKPPV
jgi:hypothetical protein